MPKKSIKPSDVIQSSTIKTTPISNSYISFSFQYFDNTSKKFSINQCGSNYFISVLERLKKISYLSLGELKTNGSKALRFHSISWQDTTEKDGFSCLNKSLMDYANNFSFQFEISANKHGRIHGFISDNVFYIVWFDPFHKLYS